MVDLYYILIDYIDELEKMIGPYPCIYLIVISRAQSSSFCTDYSK